MGCMCQLLMFTYSCDCLMHDSMSMANAVYSSLWSYLPMDKYGKLLRKDLMFVIMRSRSPCCLTACGFFPVSLETYTGVSNVIFIFIKIFLKLSKLSIFLYFIFLSSSSFFLQAIKNTTRGIFKYINAILQHQN